MLNWWCITWPIGFKRLKYLRSPNTMVSVGLITYGSTWNRPVDSLAVVMVRIFRIQHLMLSVMLEKTLGVVLSYSSRTSCSCWWDKLIMVTRFFTRLPKSSLHVSIKKYGKQELLTCKLVSPLPSLYYVLLSKIAVIFRDDFCNPESLLIIKGTCNVLSTQPLTELSTGGIFFWGAGEAHFCADCLEILGAPTFWSPESLYRDCFTFHFHHILSIMHASTDGRRW